MSKFCANCGASLEDTAVFCDKCGAKQNLEAVSPVLTAPLVMATPAADVPVKKGGKAMPIIVAVLILALIGGIVFGSTKLLGGDFDKDSPKKASDDTSLLGEDSDKDSSEKASDDTSLLGEDSDKDSSEKASDDTSLLGGDSDKDSSKKASDDTANEYDVNLLDGPYTKPVKDMVDGMEQGNWDLFISAFPPKYAELANTSIQTLGVDKDEYLKEQIDTELGDDYGANFKVNVKVVSKKEITGSDLKKAEDKFNSETEVDETFEKVYELKIKENIKGDKTSGVKYEIIRVAQIDGKWYIADTDVD